MATELYPDIKVQLKIKITDAAHAAKREFAVVGTPQLPTPWDKAHTKINNLLDELDRA
jgi:hypothetical protein